MEFADKLIKAKARRGTIFFTCKMKMCIRAHLLELIIKDAKTDRLAPVYQRMGYMGRS